MSRKSNNSSSKEEEASPPSDSVPSNITTTSAEVDHNVDDDDWTVGDSAAGVFRGISAATRKFLLASKKTILANKPIIKQTVRQVGENRPLAFASEGAVAGDSLLPRTLYYGAWTLSGVAIAADIYNKQEDASRKLVSSSKPNAPIKDSAAAAAEVHWPTVMYWTAFHIPASLVVPALIIHQIVHKVEAVVENPKGFANTWSPRARSIAPVAAALFSIIPIVPAVDHAAEYIMEPTLGSYLGLQFHHDHEKEE